MGAFEAISSIEITSNQASMSITSIPSTYQHLYLRLNLKFAYLSGTLELSGNLRLNNNSSSIYASVYQYATGGSTTTKSYSVGSGGYITAPANDAPANFFAAYECIILDYTSTSYYKNMLIRGGNQRTTSAGNIWNVHTMYQDTSAITQINVYPAIGQIVSGSNMQLYGLSGS